MTWFTHAVWEHLNGLPSVLLLFHFASLSLWGYLLNTSVTSKLQDLISQWLRPLHLEYHFLSYETFTKMAKENGLIKSFSTYFTGTTLGITAVLLGSQAILNWKAAQHMNACKPNVRMLVWQNLWDHSLSSSTHHRSLTFITGAYITLLVWSMSFSDV